MTDAGGKMPAMAAVTRLLTVVDIHDPALSPDVHGAHGRGTDGREPGWAPVAPAAVPADPHVMSVSAVHLAVLDDGRRLILLGDRGWTESGPPDVWRDTQVEAVCAQARTVVGPDEPFGGRSMGDMASEHWEHLAQVLTRQGVVVAAGELGRLPHDVELTERLRDRLGDS